MIAILFQTLWNYASHGKRLLSMHHNTESLAEIHRQYRFGPLLNVTAFLLTFVNVWDSLAMCTALAVFFAIPGVKPKSPIPTSNRPHHL